MMNPIDESHHIWPPGAQNAARPFYRLLFSGFQIPTSDAFWDRMDRDGYDGVIIGLTAEDTPNKFGIEGRANRPDKSDLHDIWRWNLRNGEEKFKRASDQAEKRGKVILPMTWLRLTEEYNQTAAEALLPLCEHPAVLLLMLNTERFFNSKLVCPPGLTREEAIEKNVVPALYGKGVRLGMTGYTYATHADKILLKYVWMVMMQAYSRGDWYRKKGLIYKAGKTQELALKVWKDIMRPDQLLVPGLACYAQKQQPGGALGWKRGKTPEARQGGLETQLREALEFSDGYAWWSWPSTSFRNGVSKEQVRQKMAALNQLQPTGSWLDHRK